MTCEETRTRPLLPYLAGFDEAPSTAKNGVRIKVRAEASVVGLVAMRVGIKISGWEHT